jgi:hypothetical protein
MGLLRLSVGVRHVSVPTEDTTIACSIDVRARDGESVDANRLTSRLCEGHVWMMTSVKVDEALLRLKDLFLGAPNMTLSVDAAARQTGLEERTCLSLLIVLEQCQFLRCSQTGCFVLNSDSTNGNVE